MPTLYSRNKQKGVLFMLAIQALAFSFTGCKKPAVSEPDKPPIASKEQTAPVAVPTAAAPSQIGELSMMLIGGEIMGAFR